MAGLQTERVGQAVPAGKQLIVMKSKSVSVLPLAAGTACPTYGVYSSNRPTTLYPIQFDPPQDDTYTSTVVDAVCGGEIRVV